MRIAGLSISEIPRLLLGLNGRATEDGAPTVLGASPPRARRFCRSWSGAGLVLLCLCLAVYLPGLVSIPPVDRDESRFAQASRQMYESGDYIVPRIQDRPRLNKPPLIYWLQCASIAVFGDREGQYPNANIWVFRLPSVLAAIASVLMTWRFGLRLFDPRAALLGAALLAVAPMIVWDAHQARADQLLLTTVIATQWALYEVWRRFERGTGLPAGVRGASPRSESHPDRARWTHTLAPIAFWLALSLGILAKGPITPMIAVLTILALGVTTRSWRFIRALRPGIGALIVLALVAPWVYAVGNRVGWSTYLTTIYNETLGRSAAPKEGHWGPPGYHTVLLCILFWPGVLTTAAAIKRAWQRTVPSTLVPPTSRPGLVGAESPGRISRFWLRLRSARLSPSLFLLAWILPAWIFFELILTKLPHYTMPMYPAIALLSSRTMLTGVIGTKTQQTVSRLGLSLWLLIAALMFGLVVALTMRPLHDGEMSAVSFPEPFFFVPAAIVVIAILAAIEWAWGRWSRESPSSRSFHWTLVGVIWTLCLVLLVIPRALPKWFDLSGRTAHGFLSGDPTRARPCAVVDYSEDSLVFWTRGRVDRLSKHDVMNWLSNHPQGHVAITARSMGWTWSGTSNPAGLVPVGELIHGTNLSAGRFETLQIFQRAENPTP